MDNNDLPLLIFTIAAFAFQVMLIVHFALRKWAFPLAIRYGRLVYGLGLVALAASLAIMLLGGAWYFWLAGFLNLAWAAYAYYTEYIRHVEWRTPFLKQVGIPYLMLYLITIMFYWFPLGRIAKSLWYLYGVLFVISTILNLTSHHPQKKSQSDS